MSFVRLALQEGTNRRELCRRFEAYVSFKGRQWIVPRAFQGERVAIRPVAAEAQYGIFFGAYRIANIDLTTEETVGHVSEQSSVMSSG